jgi:hypothetical protein
MHESHDVPDFMAFQAGFAARIRDPDNQPNPLGVGPRRMRVYEDLLFNNLNGFLRACFPLTCDVLGEPAWCGTVRRFFAEHRCHAPLFRDISGEFLGWMDTRVATLFPEHPWLHEFMHYEWLEMVVSICPDAEANSAVDPDGDLLAGVPVLDRTARLVCYHYPVHRIGPDFRPTESDRQLHCFLVFRDSNDSVRFMMLNPVTARLVELLSDGRISGHLALMRIARELGHVNTEQVLETGKAVLADLRQADVISGVRLMS